eukprot:s2497_g9.t1
MTEHGVSWSAVFDGKNIDAEEVSSWLVAYGHEMHLAGKSHTRYSEAFNDIAGRRPILKRQLTESWNLAFAASSSYADECDDIPSLRRSYVGVACRSSDHFYDLDWHPTNW